MPATLTADQIPAMLDSPQFAGLPPERRTDLLERALADGAQSMAGQWDQPTFQKWGEFANRAREKVQGMETIGEKAVYVGDVLARTGGDMLKMVGATAAGMSPIAAPRSGPEVGRIVPQVPGETLLKSAGANAAALATNIADAVTRDAAPVQDELSKLKQQIDQGAFFDHPQGFDGWLTEATGQVRDKAAKYYEDSSYAEQNDVLANPQNKELLQNYLLTRSPQAWEALTSNVLRTPGAATMQAERQAIQQDSPLGRSLGKASSQYIGEATDPAELAGMAMGLGAGKAIVEGGQSMLRRGAALAGGVAGEVGSEQVSAFMEDPNMSWAQRQQIAKDALIAGLGFAGVGAGAQALANRSRTATVPPQAQEAGVNPFAGPIQAPPQPTEAGGVVEPPPPQRVPPFQDDPLGTLAEAGSANVIQNFGIQRSPEAQAKAMAEEQQRAQVEATARSLQAKAGNGRPVIPDSPLGGRDILDFVNEHPLNMPRKGTELGRSGEFDWTQGFEMPAYYRKYLVSTERGYAPDQLAQMAYDEGLIAEPTPDALTSAMQDTMRARTQFKAEFRAREKEMKAAESGLKRFDASQQKPKGKTELGFEDVAPGDTMTIEGEPVTIRKVDYDEDGYLTEIVIEDGKKFGVMSLDPQTRGGILVDAKSYQPRERLPGMSDAIANEDGSVDITLPDTPALQERPQTITGSNEQTGSEMPVPPPTAAAGAGAGGRIVAAAVIQPDGSIATGRTHREADPTAPADRQARETPNFGFIVALPNGAQQFVSREQAAVIAQANGQLIEGKTVERGRLHSDQVRMDKLQPPTVDASAGAGAVTRSGTTASTPATGQAAAPVATSGGVVAGQTRSGGGVGGASGQVSGSKSQVSSRNVLAMPAGLPQNAPMASASGAAQANEPSPGGLSEAEDIEDNAPGVFRLFNAIMAASDPGSKFTDAVSIQRPGNRIAGYFLGASKEAVKGYGNVVKELAVTITNPLVLERESYTPMAFYELMSKEANVTLDAEDLSDLPKEPVYTFFSPGMADNPFDSRDLARQLVANGYDAVVMWDDSAYESNRKRPTVWIPYLKADNIEVVSSFESSRAAGGTSEVAALPAKLQMPAVRGPLPSSYGGALPPSTVKAWSGKLRTIHGIRQHLLRSIGLPAAGVGRFTKKALGIYQVKPETIRLQAINDVPVLAHEIGHAIHFRVLSDDPAKASDWGGTYDGELNALGAATSAPGYTADQIRKEGVAEFTRLWLTDGAKARASAPRFAAFFEQQLDERAPQMAKTLRESRDMIEDYIAMPAFKKAEAQVVFDPAMEKPKSTWRDWMRSGYTKWFNTLHPIEQVLKRVETAEPSLAAEAQRLAAYTDNHRGGWSSKAHADLFNHQTNLKGERVGESFAAILKDVKPGRAKALSTYLALKRAAEIERSGKRSGFENARLPAAEMKALEAEFEGVRQRLMKWQQNELNLLVESGLLDSKTARAMSEANRDYVPFYRLYERVNGVSFGPEASKNAGGYVDLNSGIKRLKGSDRAIIDPLQSMMKNAFMFRKIAEQNQIGQQFFDLIEQVQGHGQWGEGIKPKITGKTITHAAVVDKLKEQGIIENESDLPSDADLTLRLWEAVKRPDTANGEVIVFKNGQRKHYEVKDKLLMEALKTADADAIRLGKFLGPTMTKLATLPTRALRFGATGGPWFALPNFVRDQWIAGLQSKTGFLPFVDGIKGAFNVIAKTDAYQRWIEAGGKYHGLTTGTEAFNALLEDALPKDRTARAMLAEMGKPSNWIKAIGEAGRILEEASRVQEFVRAERMGLSKMEAANASKAITLNFARAGERARVFNMLVPFLNAQLQQLDVLVNLHKDPKRRGQVISRGLMLITVPSVLTWWLGKDDEEIQNLPEWRKNLFWNLNLKPVAKALGMGEGFILSVPKPFLMGAIYGTSVERLLDYATNRDPNGAKKAFGAIYDQMPHPIDMLLSISGMRPVIESLANYDLYRGRDIIPQSMQDMPKPFQYDLSTSETAKLVGKWTGQSPMMIDHLIGGYFATAGQWGTGAIDWGMAKLGVADVPPAPAMSLMERPILNKFSGSPYAANAWLPRFYDAAHEMEGLLRVWTKQSQQMTSAEQAKWWKQHGQEILFYQRTINPQTGLTGAGDVRKAMERVSELGKAMKEVQANKVMSPELKRQRLIELSNQRNRIAEESYKAVFPKAVRERHY